MPKPAHIKRPFCIIDGEYYQLRNVNGVIRFRNDGRKAPYDLNRMVIDYAYGRIPLKTLFDYYINSGSSYELVYGLFSKCGINNHTVTQGKEPTKHFYYYPDSQYVKHKN